MARKPVLEVILALGFAVLSPADLRADSRGGGPREATGPEEAAPADGATLALTIPDTPVLTQDGERVRFHTDLVADKVVAINFIFTTCTTVCPPLGVTFGKLQKLLGDRLGRDVRLISVSVDPATDTPERLKAWGRAFGAGPGWTLVTGRKADIDELLKALNAYSSRPEDHSPMVLIGNGARRRWTRAYGLSPASTLVKAIEEAMAGPGAEAAPAREGER
jgi:protein SCO1